MIHIDSIASQVKHNCNISDARYWGYYSPCGLLLRLRDLYRIEKRLKPWESPDHLGVRDWIQEQERRWQELEQSVFGNITINGKSYGPFDVKNINTLLVRHGYVYGAGQGHLLKPVFILAKLSEKRRNGRFTVYIMGREFARDLSTTPAMIQGNTAIIRQESMDLFFWDRLDEMKAKKCHGALRRAFSAYGIRADHEKPLSPVTLRRRMNHLVSQEINTFIHHEIGEASQRKFLGRWWKELVGSLPYSRAELYLRALKDVLADTCDRGLLRHIISEQKKGSLYFYIALLGGYRKNIFPHIIGAGNEFAERGDWHVIERARTEGNKAARSVARKLRSLSGEGRLTPEVLEREFLPG